MKMTPLLHAWHDESLRDLYAGMAMQQMCAGEGAMMVAARDERYNESNWKEIVASCAYDFADAMMAERKKRYK